MQYVVVPETDDPESPGLQPSSTTGVPFPVASVIVVAAIEFDDQPVFEAGEIDDVGAKRVLTAKACLRQATAAQMTPECPLRIRGVATKLACEIEAWLPHDRQRSSGSAAHRVTAQIQAI